MMTKPGNLFPDKWVDNYADMLYRFLLVRTSDAAIAEDLVQETFLSAWKYRNSYQGEVSEKNWLFAICKNKLIDHYRRQAASIVLPASEDELYFDEKEHWRAGASPKGWGIDYDEPLDTKEFYKALDACRNKLKTLQQQVFSMRYLSDMDAPAICSILNITAANYWVIIHRCKLQLRSCLEKNWLNIY